MNKPRFDRDHAEDEDRRGRGEEGRALRDVRRRAGAAGSRSLTTSCCMSVGRSAEREEDRRRQGRRRRLRSRFHPGRQPDAHQRPAHLRDRRHRRPADARAQGRARRPRRAEAAVGAEESFFDARVIPSVAYTDPGDRVGRRHRGRGEGEGRQGREGSVPVGRVGPRDRQRPRRRLHEAAVRRRDASHRRRRHRRHARRRSDQRDRARDRDGRRRGRHRHGRSIRIRRCPSRSASPPRCSRACARTCRRRGRSSGTVPSRRPMPANEPRLMHYGSSPGGCCCRSWSHGLSDVHTSAGESPFAESRLGQLYNVRGGLARGPICVPCARAMWSRIWRWFAGGHAAR